MLAMQYSIPLPLDFNAEKIRERVSARKTLFDDHAGLLHKSFIYSEEDHLYAPFYVWKNVAEARDFLVDDLFKGVIEAFSRHRVRSWIVLDMEYGNKALQPAFARREVEPIAAEESLRDFRLREKFAQQSLLTNDGLYMHLVALDVDRWEVMRYSLWRDISSAPKTQSDCVQDYGVLHVSTPGGVS